MNSQLFCSRHVASIAFLTLALLSAGCQQDEHPRRDAASLLIKAPWNKTVITPGLTWERYLFPDLFGAPQSVNVLRLDLSSDLRLSFAVRETGRETTTVMAERHGALAAVNGTFFALRGNQAGTPLCYIKIDGQVRATTVGGRGMGGVTVEEDGTVGMIWRPRDGWETADLPHSVLVSGPIIDWDGIPRPRHEPLERHPRTAVGITPNRGHLLLVTVDGRTSESAGVTLPELREIMSAVGANRSMNLDGGGSSTMWIRDRGGVVNFPCDNGRFDHAGERAVSNAILILPPLPAQE